MSVFCVRSPSLRSPTEPVSARGAPRALKIGRTALVDCAARVVASKSMQGPLPTNRDFLKWFSDDERSSCPSCGERACVTVEGALATFCLGCGAVWIEGERIDRKHLYAGRRLIGRIKRRVMARH